MTGELLLIAKATVIFAAALGAARLARSAPASLRALILASAFALVFLLPVGSALAPAREVEIPASYASVFFIEEPTLGSDADLLLAPPPRGRSAHAMSLPPFATVLRVVWAAGATVFVVPLLLGLWRTRGIRRRSIPWDTGQLHADALLASTGTRRRVAVVVHTELLAPMTCGWLRPLIALPDDATRWPEADVRQALLHELEHVRRHDWPLHVLARLTCALYWFHPAAWIAWRQLSLESERACDDAVVAKEDTAAYAEQLVSLARRLSTNAAPLLSMADRRTLATRVAAILNGNLRRGSVGAGYAAAVLVSAVTLIATISPLQARPSPQSSGRPNVTIDPALRFGVASVRPNDGSDPSRGFGFTLQTGRLRLRNQTLRTMISVAYSQPFSLFFPDERITGGPSWMNTDRFTIEARAERPVTANEMGAMLRALLADRFKLIVRTETRQVPTYVLVLSKPGGRPGPELRPSKECTRCGIGGGPGRYQLSGATMPLLAASLTELVGRPVVDRTGLDGSFEGTLTWAPTPEELGALGEPAPRAQEFGASLFTALEEQFGLKLQSERGGVDYLIVESAEQPTPNDAPELSPNAAVQATPSRQAFEVASVRLNKSGSERSRGPMIQPGNRLLAENVMARSLITTAYGLRWEQVVGGPGWLDTDHWDVEARAPETASLENVRAMLRTLLADRFGLVARREAREQDLYTLIPAGGRRSTPGLRTAAPACTPIRPPARLPIVSTPDSPAAVGTPEGEPVVSLGSPPKCQRMSFPGFLGARQIGMPEFAALLTMFARRHVIDRTGMTGDYDIDLTFASDPASGSGDAVSLFTALQDQLGLKLEGARGPIDMLVIDSAEKPQPN